MKDLATLEAIVSKLHGFGFTASLEYPDFILVEDLVLEFSEEGNSFTWNTWNGVHEGEIFSTDPEEVAKQIDSILFSFVSFELTEKGKEATK